MQPSTGMAAAEDQNRGRPGAALFACAVFLAAFLLFAIQPLIAKRILPWFGGGASVWTAAMLFFQAALLAGYAYAHWFARRLTHRLQIRLYLLALALSVLLLPLVFPASYWKPAGVVEPISRIISLLTCSIGVQYVLLAATSPLLQAVWVRATAEPAPYHWYALSNAGSLLGLLSYPVAIEPLLGTRAQAAVWSLLYALYAILIGCVFLYTRRLSASPAAELTPREESPKVAATAQLTWVYLPAVASMLLLAGTAYVTENVIPVPLIWVLPLSAYLLSFVFCFGRTSWYRPAVFSRLAMAALLGMAWLVQQPTLAYWVGGATAIVTAGVFLVATYCHGEVVLRRPEADGLTRFYLLVAAGGALGGVMVTIAAPALVPLPIDFPIALAFAAVSLAVFEWRRTKSARVLSLAGAAVVVSIGVRYASALTADSVALIRNFYGTLRITEEYAGLDPIVRARILTHGVIQHGSQLLDSQLRRRPTMYYGFGSGVHLAIEQTRRANQRIGIVGLGAGTLAAYGRSGDVYRFYEINPQVVRVARTWFTYLDDSAARVEIVPGDARLSLEREPPQDYDLLVLDAFSSDAIPAHLLTREAMRVYLRHIRTGGMIAIHVSNKVLHLVPVVAALAHEYKMPGLVVDTGGDSSQYRDGATWVLMSSDPRRFSTLGEHGLWGKGVPAWSDAAVPVWTDDYSSIWQLLH